MALKIDHLSQVAPLFAECLSWLKCQDYQFKGVKLKIGLLPKEQMAKLVNLPQDDLTLPLGLTRSRYSIRGALVSDVEVDSIVILAGLSEVQFRHVLIHELGHAWIALNEIQGLPLWVEEGFCELLSYQYLKSCNQAVTLQAAESIVHRSDRIYGAGFSVLRDFSFQYGINRLRDDMLQVKGLPQVLKQYVIQQVSTSCKI